MSTLDQDLPGLHRLLYRHQWTDVADWGRAIAALADLSEAEIDRLVAAGCPATARAAPAAAAIDKVSG